MSRIRDAAIVLGLVFTAAFQAAPAFAQAPAPSGGSKSFQTTLETGLNNAAPDELKASPAQKDLSVLVGRIISSVLGLLGVVLLGYFLYAGFLWMTAGGESKKVDLARDHIKNAIIGLIIITLSYAAATFVISRLSTVLTAT